MWLLFMAAIPIVVMSAFIVWQTSQYAGQQVRQTVLLARENAAAQHQSAVATATQLVRMMALTPEASNGLTGECASLLSRLAIFNAATYAGALMTDEHGAVRCGVGEQEALESALSSANRAWLHGGSQPAFESEPISFARGEDIVIAAPIIDAGHRMSGVVAVLLRMSVVIQPSSDTSMFGGDAPKAWLIGSSGAPPASMNGDQDLPALLRLPELLASPGLTTLTRSRGGDLFAYAATRLPDSLILLAGFRAQELIGPARNLLVLRIVVIFLVLFSGMAVMAIGANRAVAQPVKILTQSVRRWRERGGERFEPGRLDDAPAEIAELSRAFADTATELADREQKLRSSLAHQDILMREIHHRVKNNLQIVASLLNLQASRIIEPAARTEFQSARDRVRALATLHRHLYADADLHSIRMRGFLIELCEPLFLAAGETPNERIALHVEATDVSMSGDQATPLALIVTEAVSNALRHGFPGRRHGHISVCLTAQDGCAELLVKHDGVGIAETSNPGKRGGLGLQLIRGFARQLGSDLVIEDLRPGTSYAVRLQLNPVHESGTAAAPASSNDVSPLGIPGEQRSHIIDA